MKVGVVYTVVTQDLVETVEVELRKALPEAELISFRAPDVLEHAKKCGHISAQDTAVLVTLYMEAVKAGAEAILNVCSSVGDIADAVQPLAQFMGIPIVRIDEKMCAEAIRLGRRIGVMATLNTTMSPTKRTILRLARDMGKEVELVDALVDNAFGLDREMFQSQLLKKAQEIQNHVDVILFAQGSMAYCESYISKAIGLPVLSSPRFGAQALADAIKQTKDGNS